MSPTRYGDPDHEPVDEPPEPHECRRGWLDPDADTPVPCLVCKPWLKSEQRVHRVGE